MGEECVEVGGFAGDDAEGPAIGDEVVCADGEVVAVLGDAAEVRADG